MLGILKWDCGGVRILIPSTECCSLKKSHFINNDCSYIYNSIMLILSLPYRRYVILLRFGSDPWEFGLGANVQA